MAAVVLAAAIGGLLVGGSLGGGGGASAPRSVTPAQSIVHDGVRLQVPTGWARGDATAVPGFSRPLALRNSDEGLRATVERLPATSATLLPAAFLKTLASAPGRPEVVRLSGGRQAWRYRFPATDGSMTFMYAAPTTTGVATIACTAPIDASIPRGCTALAAAVTVPESQPLEPGASAAFYSRLPSVVTDLDASRDKGIAQLRAAKRARGQALAADGLARAHKTAGATLAPLAGEQAGAPAATVGALTATGTAYRALAGAARTRLPQPYADARRAVTGAETDLRRAMTGVSAAVSAATRSAEQKATAPVKTPPPSRRPRPRRRARRSRPRRPRARRSRPRRPRARRSRPKTPSTTVPAAKTPSTTVPAAKTPSTTDPATKTSPNADPAATAEVDPVTKTPSTAESVLKAPADARPAASAAGGVDLTLILLALFGVVAVYFAIRGARRALR